MWSRRRQNHSRLVVRGDQDSTFLIAHHLSINVELHIY
jgi:hypothetical protein